MKKVFTFLFTMITIGAAAQTGTFSRITVLDSMLLNTHWLRGISDDTTMGTGQVNIIPSQYAVKAALGQYVLLSQKGAANGVATLDGTGKVNSSQLGVIGTTSGGTGLSSLGTANQLIKVNSGATALEYFTPTYISGNQNITLTGDITGSGTTAISTTLANTGTAGTYTKVTTDSKGRITSGTTLAAGDIPNLDVSKLTSGTLGITRGGTGLSALGTDNQLLRVNAGATALEYFSFPDASTVTTGSVNTSAQTFAGLKTFSNGITTPSLSTTSNELALSVSNTFEVMRLFVGGASRKVSINNTTNIGSTLNVWGSLSVYIRTVAVTTTLDDLDHTLIVNNSAAATVNLPAASTAMGRIYVVKKISGAALDVTIDPAGTEQIDGSGNYILSTQWSFVKFQSNGNAWYIIAK